MSVQSVERAFTILRVLARGPMGVTEIADQADLPKSTVSRLLASLEIEGAVEQVEAGGGYAIGETLAVLGASNNPTAGLRSTVRPFIEELAMVSGGSAGFTIREGDTAYWVDNVEHGDEFVTLADQTGQSFPLHTIPSGIALLSRFTADELERYLSVEHLWPDGSPVDPDVVLQRIADIGSNGVVVSNEVFDAGVNAFAAPFRGPDGSWVGAIYLQGPSFRFPDEGDERRIVHLVREAAEQLSVRLTGS